MHETARRLHATRVVDYRERYDLTQMINVIEQIANALAFAHQKGVSIDIKPENILVGRFGEIVCSIGGGEGLGSSSRRRELRVNFGHEPGSANDGKPVWQ